MSKGLMGKKLGMTGLFAPDGRYVPVTVIEAGPCVVTQIKTTATDGYNALQLGFSEVKAKRVTKPRQGHFRKSGETFFRHVQEFPVDNPEAYSLGQKITLEIFSVGERVDVCGTTKGRGFAGVMKKEGFSGGPAAHGSKCHRIPGSIGTSAWPSRVFKGRGMPGHYGVDHQTMQNIEIVDIRPEENILMVKGAVPGPTTGLVAVKKQKIVRKK
jgi:large subunit ribosomal protein L3